MVPIHYINAGKRLMHIKSKKNFFFKKTASFNGKDIHWLNLTYVAEMLKANGMQLTNNLKTSNTYNFILNLTKGMRLTSHF